MNWINGLKIKMANRQYSCIVKVDAERFVKYRTVNNLLKFTSFLDVNFPTWRYYNVYSKETKQQVASFTKGKRPQQAQV
jgi:hypothetical protein